MGRPSFAAHFAKASRARKATADRAGRGGALDAAVKELTRDRSALSLVEANREIDKLLRGGVKVTIPDRERGGQRTEVVRVIDWAIFPAEDGGFPGSRRDRANTARSKSRRFCGFHRSVKWVIRVKFPPCFTKYMDSQPRESGYFVNFGLSFTSIDGFMLP